MKITIETKPPLPANERHGVIEYAPVSTYHINFDDVDNWLRDEATDEQRDDSGWSYDDETLQKDHTACMFTEASNTVIEQLYAFGLRHHDAGLTIVCYWEPTDRMTWVLHQFEGVSAVTNLVHKSYEHTAPDVNDWGPMLSDLSGDDDVDYSGSYIDIGIETIVAYLNAKINDVVPS